MPYSSIWTRRLQKAANTVNAAHGVFVGYNACIDYLEYLDPQHLEKIFKELTTDSLLNRYKIGDYPKKIETNEDFFVSLLLAISSGKAKQIPTYSDNLTEELNELFNEADEHRMGGQSGIIANLLGQLGLNTIIYIPNLSHVQARRFYKENILFPVKDEELGVFTLRNVTKCPQENVITKINWIFEYEEGISFPIQQLSDFITAPRSNRLIIASRPKDLMPGFSDEIRQYLPELGSLVDRAILSGYQYLTEDHVEDWMKREQENIKELTSRNSDLRLHLEFASISNEFVRSTILHKMKSQIHSLGFNEVELRTILHDVGEFEAEKDLIKDENPKTLYEGVKIAKERLKIPRLHLHTLAYHIMFLDLDYSSKVTSNSAQNAMLYSAVIGTAKTLVGEFTSRNIKDFEIKLALQLPISYTGVKALEFLAKSFKKSKKIQNIRDFLIEGIIKEKKHFEIFIPSQLTPASQLKSTVGLGDSISSTAFTFDQTQ